LVENLPSTDLRLGRRGLSTGLAFVVVLNGILVAAWHQ
jgi:hypothetical protein